MRGLIYYSILDEDKVIVKSKPMSHKIDETKKKLVTLFHFGLFLGMIHSSHCKNTCSLHDVGTAEPSTTFTAFSLIKSGLASSPACLVVRLSPYQICHVYMKMVVGCIQVIKATGKTHFSNKTRPDQFRLKECTDRKPE